jgi:hypothetical protein
MACQTILIVRISLPSNFIPSWLPICISSHDVSNTHSSISFGSFFLSIMRSGSCVY